MITPSFWESEEGCWACRVAAGTSPASIVLETPAVVAVVNPFPLAAGHTLVMPRAHVPNLYDLPDELAGPVLTAAGCVARAQKRALAADGVTLRQNNEPASDQHLFHFHLHVIPRFAGDADRFAAEPKLTSRAEQDDAAARLRAALAPS
jgi:histidine triad (HIT) family protein